MKVTAVQSPASVQNPQTTNNTEARARAIARLTEQPVPNANQISPEELGAIRAPTPQIDTSTVSEETQPAEVAAEPAKQAPKEDPLSSQYAMLARREKALRAKAQQQEQALKAREQALAEREAQLRSQPAQPTIDTSKYISIDEFKADPLKIMAQTGLSYDQITEQLINQQPRDPRTEATISRLEAQIRKLEAAIDDSQKAYTNNQQQAYQSAVKQIELDVTNLVKTDANFETIKATGSIKDVVQLIEETYKKDGILMSVEEAATEVENYLVDEALKLSRINKIQQRLNASASKSQTTAPAQTPAAQPKQPQPMKTLTNATSSTRTLSARERALLAFKGELK
jgi:hypothetical protein